MIDVQILLWRGKLWVVWPIFDPRPFLVRKTRANHDIITMIWWLSFLDQCVWQRMRGAFNEVIIREKSYLFVMIWSWPSGFKHFSEEQWFVTSIISYFPIRYFMVWVRPRRFFFHGGSLYKGAVVWNVQKDRKKKKTGNEMSKGIDIRFETIGQLPRLHLFWDRVEFFDVSLKIFLWLPSMCFFGSESGCMRMLCLERFYFLLTAC